VPVALGCTGNNKLSKGGLLNIKKSLLVTGVSTGIALAGIMGLGVASAATSSTNHDDIITKLATKFNLSKDDVAAVFEENQAERQTERQQQVEQRLAAAVQKGDITEQQKQLLLAKRAELLAKGKANHEELKDITPAERHKLRQQHHDELQQWAKDNGIPMEYLHLVGPGHQRPGKF
jgi:hypothetical protein